MERLKVSSLTMKNFVTPHQNTIAQFSDYQAAQNALSMLREGGLPIDKFSVVPEALDPNPTFNDTEAAKGAGVGAMTGAAFGGSVGGLIAYVSSLSTGSESFNWVGLVLAGSGVGALAMSILGAFSGTNVHKNQMASATDQYVLIADVTPAELEQAQLLLQKSDASITPN